MYVSMVKSRIVEDAVIHHYDLQREYHKKYIPDTRKIFEKRATVDGTPKTASSTSPSRTTNRAAEIANGCVEQFRTLSQHLAITEAAQRRSFL